MKIPTTQLIGLGVLLPLSFFWGYFILGQETLKINQTNWLWGDLAQVYLSWKLYLSDPNAHWLLSNRMSYPLEMNFSLFDPIPILLLTAGKLSNLLPDGQYLGLYFAACIILQGFFGYLTIGEIVKSKIAPNNWKELIKVIGGCFFILTPYTFWRFQGHTALASQWLIVCNIWVSLRTSQLSTNRWLFANCGTLFIISGFNPYLTLMAALSTGVLLVAGYGANSASLRALKLAALGFTAIAGFYVFGFLGAATVDGGGYGAYSMNMLGPFDSNSLALLLPLDIPDATQQQTFEGFNYLGAGLLLMVASTLALLSIKSPNNLPTAPHLLQILMLVAISYLLALSTTLTLSMFKVQLPAPDFLEAILSRFRASGRLFWIGSFWLIVAGFITATSKLEPIKSSTLLFILLVIQLADVTPIAKSIRNSITQFQHLQIPEQDLKLIPKTVDKIMVFPPWQCAQGASPGGVRNYEIFGYLTAKINASTNNFYAARTLAEQKKYHCDYSNFTKNLSKSSVYFLSNKFFQHFKNEIIHQFDCTKSHNIADTIICSPKP